MDPTTVREQDSEFRDLQQQDQLMLTGNVVNVIHRQGSQIETQPDDRHYHDYLQGEEKNLEQAKASTTGRAKTPVLEGSFAS